MNLVNFYLNNILIFNSNIKIYNIVFLGFKDSILRGFYLFYLMIPKETNVKNKIINYIYNNNNIEILCIIFALIVCLCNIQESFYSLFKKYFLSF